MKITKRILGLILAIVLALSFLPMIVANAAAGDATEKEDGDISIDIGDIKPSDPDEDDALPGDIDENEQVTEDDAIYLLLYVLFGEEMYPTDAECDLDGNVGVTEDDAIYLLLHVLFGEEMYPTDAECDLDGNVGVTEDDAIYLLLHVLFGEEMYPLN